jgi:Fusaric acid resistance protein family
MKPTPSLKQRLVYPLRTTIAAVLALLVAHVVGLREVYWAAVSAIIVVQSDFGSSLLISWQRLAGTAIGAAIGAALAQCAVRNALVYGGGVLGVGVLSAVLRLDRPANRFRRGGFYHRVSPRAPRSRLGRRAPSVHRGFDGHHRGTGPQCRVAGVTGRHRYGIASKAASQ